MSDTEVSDLSPDAADAEKTATVERKLPSAAAATTTAATTTPAQVTTTTNGSVVKEDSFDATAVPQHELLDSSMNKSKSELGK